jgi:hypothetical protein
MNYDLKNIQVLGYTTDFCQCECCGKENLRGTVSILDVESGVVLHFGTTCAVKADKYDGLEAAAKAKKEIAKELRVVEDWKRYAWGMRRKLNIAVEKVDALADAFVAHMSNKETRLFRFNWEAWK